MNSPDRLGRLMKLDLPRRRVVRVSLTPLIDIIFILLIFFMLSTQFVQWRRLEIGLGTVTAAQVARSPQIIQLDEQGTLYFEGQPYDLPTLAVTLLISPDRPVVLQPAANSTTQHIVHTLDGLYGLGIERVGLSSEPRNAP